MTCPGCGATADPSARFCAQCGVPIAATCTGCGAPRTEGARFCASCGTSLVPAADPGEHVAAVPVGDNVRAAERRLVSVLFADLVGFTTLSESRDSEEVRELLTRYFDVCRTLVVRHGGVVEKFIGDAVMAVWGAPSANEDDAERAVRTALQLVAAVEEMGQDVGAPGLSARAGVLTGEAAVTLGATGEGLVAGDLVNTASRVQSVAAPGTVLVGEATRRATDAAVRYEPAGVHQLKGRAQPVHLFRALDVVAGRSGSMRTEGMEAPFVGRDRELRMLKDLYHSSADHSAPQLVTITGTAGVGKSRLSWEFEKYVDGLAGTVYWHRGRCLSYGDGVTYWALADMMRSRIGAVEGEAPEQVATKLATVVDRFVPDLDERKWVEARLGQLLGLEDHLPARQDDQFAAWRLFLERMSETGPVVLVFEDLQWADASFLDFVDHLLEWSRNHPIFVLALSRPELLDKRPTWGAGRRNFSSVHLDPLEPAAMERLLAGLVPGLPSTVTTRILSRAEGVPLYAVETVRMLLDHGRIAPVDGGYRPTGPIEELDVPETLHGLIAARLDGLSTSDRRLVEDAAVLGRSFTPAALSAVSGEPADVLAVLLPALVRREVLTVTSDPRSPERGNYAFVQDLLRKVAYDTLSRHDRRAKHLAVASHLEAGGDDEDDVVELVASHLLEALHAVPDAPDAARTRDRARRMLLRAADRADALAAPAEVWRYTCLALELTDDVVERAALLERAGQAALLSGRSDEARDLLELAGTAFDSAGLVHEAARASARLAEVDFFQGSLHAAIDRLQAALAVLASDDVDADIAEASAQLARLLFFVGRARESHPHLELALAAAEQMSLPEVLAQALNTKSLVLLAERRPTESDALLEKALSVALEHDLHNAALRAYFNLAERLADKGKVDEALDVYEVALTRARRVGDQFYNLSMRAGSVTPLLTIGRWDEAISIAHDVTRDVRNAALQLVNVELVPAAGALVRRGDVTGAREFLARLHDGAESENIQNRAAQEGVLAAIARAEGRPAEALHLGRRALSSWEDLGLIARAPVDGFVAALEAAFDLDDDVAIDQLLEFATGRSSGEVMGYFDAQRLRFEARRCSRRGDDDGAVRGFEQARSGFIQMKNVYWRAVCELEAAENHLDAGRVAEAESLLRQARATFDAVGARPMLERIDLLPVGATAVQAG